MARRPSSRPRGRGHPQAQSAYERRIADYLAKHPGASRQEARGHKAREHVERRERERRESDTTTAQRGVIRKWVREQARRNGARASEVETMIAHMIGLVAQRGQAGYEAFKAMTAELRRMNRTRSHQGKVIVLAGRAQNLGIMEEFAAEWDIDLEWLFYG